MKALYAMKVPTVPAAAVPSREINRQLLALSLPLTGTQLANIALAATDTVMMGHLSTVALAGGGLAVVWFNQVRTMAVGLLTPLGNRIAAAHAQLEGTDATEAARAASMTQETEATSAHRARRAHVEIRNLTRTGLLLATLSGLIGAVALIAISYALPFFGQSAEVTSAATSMMWVLAPGLIPCLWFQVSRQFCVGLGKPQSLLGITIAMIAVNVALNFALGFGLGPIPALGVAGIGLSTTLVHLISALIYLRLISRNSQLAPFHAVDFWRRTQTSHQLSHDLKTQLRLGLPVSATYGAEAGMFSVLAMLMGTFGAEALAAHNVVYQVTFIVFQIGVGFSHGSSILVSRAWSVHDYTLARRIGLRAQGMMVGVVALAAAFFLLIPHTILAPFFRDATPATATLAVGLLAIGAVMEFVDTAQNVAIGLLRGTNDTKTGLKASLVGYWLIGLPSAVLFAYAFNLGACGIWWGLTAGLASTVAILWWSFFAKIRTSAATNTANPADTANPATT